MNSLASTAAQKTHKTRPVPEWLLYLPLLIVALINLTPFYFTLVGALQPATHALGSGPPPIWPESFNWQNFAIAWERGHFGLAMTNTLFLATLSALARILGGAMAGYAFAKTSFPGEKWIFAVLLLSIMIPTELTLVPSYLVMKQLGWINTFLPFIVPGLGDVFTIFFFRQFMQTLPTTMLEAARIDGASEPRIFFQLVIPNALPALASLFILNFQSVYNDFQGPLIYLNDERLYTVQLQLKQFERLYGTNYDNILGSAANLLTCLPVIVVFIIFQRQLIQGISTTGIKG